MFATVTWPAQTVIAVLTALEEGATLSVAAARFGVPPASARNWRRGRLPRSARLMQEGRLCGRCNDHHDLPGLPAPEYAQLLGLYLGDGWLSAQAHDSWSLRIAMDERYPPVVEETRAVMARISPRRRAAVLDSGRGYALIYAYSNQWPCLFPQHGPGKKHHRRIALEPWQQAHVDAAPFRFLRGLIHSDGWRGVNKVRAKGRDYAYPRYQFSSRSDDIRRLFTDTCDRVGVAWRPWGRWHVSVARRDSVALLDEHIGEKA
jgi:hypothetical protein